MINNESDSSMPAILTTQKRLLPIKMRADLIVQPQSLGGKRYWGIKDPLALQFYHLQEEEYAILCLLDGNATVASIRAQFENQFAPQKLSTPQLYRFLELLHSEGLVISDRSGQAEELYEKGEESRRRSFFARLTHLLAIRFRGIDPTVFLEKTAPYVKWCFSTVAVFSWLMFVLTALLLLLVQIDVVQTRLPTMQAFLHPGNLVWLAITLAGIKVLHELGHAYACKYFGGECFELGLMLLAFTPCLYCNVTDAWMFPNKWRRISVSAAGIYVELFLASACTLLWWFSEPGLLNSICFNVMTICSVGTLLINGNPLLRYDGYFILSDLIEVPNLRQQSQALWSDWLQRIFFGYSNVNRRTLPNRVPLFLVLYGIGSFLYRWVVIYAILWFLHRALQPYHLEAIARIVTVLVLTGMLAPPTWRAASFLLDPTRNYRVNWFRFTFGAVILSLFVTVLLAIPLPRTVTVPVIMEPVDASRVYVSVPGVLQFAATEGTEIEQGDQLGELINYEIQQELEALRSSRDQQLSRLNNLKKQQVTNRQAQQQIQTAKATLQDLSERLAKRTDDFKQLTLVAPVSGKVLSAPRRKTQSAQAENPPNWSGSPLDPKNKGCLLETGTLFCLIGDPHRLAAVALVNQSDIEAISVNQAVTLQINQLPETFLTGTVVEIAGENLKLPPREFGQQNNSQENQQQQELLQTGYRLRIFLEETTPTLLQGAAGQAKIKVAPQSLGRRLIRYLAKTFRFQW